MDLVTLRKTLDKQHALLVELSNEKIKIENEILETNRTIAEMLTTVGNTAFVDILFKRLTVEKGTFMTHYSFDVALADLAMSTPLCDVISGSAGSYAPGNKVSKVRCAGVLNLQCICTNVTAWAARHGHSIFIAFDVDNVQR